MNVAFVDKASLLIYLIQYIAFFQITSHDIALRKRTILPKTHDRRLGVIIPKY